MLKAVLFVSLLLIVNTSYCQLGKGGYYLLKSRAALNQKKIQVAEQYADSVLMAAILSNHPDSLMNAYQWLSDFYAATKDYQKSLENLKVAAAYHDTLGRIRQKLIQTENDSSIVLLKKGHQKELSSLKDRINDLEIIADRTAVNSLIILAAVIVLLGIVIVLLIRKNKQTNEQLRQVNAELLQMQSYREKLFTVLSFELKNSLSSFEKLSKGLSGLIPSLNKDDAVQFLKNLHATAGDLKNNLTNVLQWAGFKAEANSLRPVVFDGKELSEQTLEKFKVELEAKKLHSQVFMPPDGQTVLADKVMIGIVLDNLMSNAIHHTPAGGDITFFSGRKDGLVTLGIKDTGVGISEENLSNLFKVKKDVAGEKVLSRGLGLGLALSKELIELNGGRLYIESIVGQGTTVYFSLPESNFGS